jgi:hypothetical protein
VTEKMHWKVPIDLPFEELLEIRDGLQSGRISIKLADHIKSTPEIEFWLQQITQQLVDAYDERMQQLIS